MTHTAIWEKVIGGALCRLKGDELQFQPRNDRGECCWLRIYRDTFCDGWTGDKFWLAPNEVDPMKRQLKRLEAIFYDEPFGWTLEQITQAKVWAGDVLATRKIARTFAPVREAAE